MKIAIIKQFNNNKINFKSNENFANITYPKKKSSSDIVEIKTKKQEPKFWEEIKDYIECLFLKDTITYGSSKKKKIKVLTESYVPEKDAIIISNLGKKGFENAMELLMNGAEPEIVARSADFSEEQIKQARTLLKKGTTDEDLIELSKLSSEDFKDIMQLSEDGLGSKTLVLYSQSTIEQKAETKKLLEQGETPEKAVILPKFSSNKEKENLFLELLDLNFSVENAYKYAEKIDLHDKIRELAYSGAEEDGIDDYIGLSEEEEKRNNELIQIGIARLGMPELAKLPQQDFDTVKNMILNGTLADIAKNIFEIETGKEKNPKYEHYIQKGYGKNGAFSMSQMEKEDIDTIKAFKKEQPIVEEYLKNNYDIVVTNLQKNNKKELTFTKEFYDNGTRVILVDTLNSDKELKKYRIEYYQDGTGISSTQTGNKSIFIKRDKKGVFSEITEFEKDKTGAVTGVIHSKLSKDLLGVMETTYYDIDDFISDNNPENIAKNISDAVKTKGKEISKVTKNPDGSIEYKEKHTTRGYTTERYFKKNANNTERNYSYRITYLNGNELINISNYWKKNPDNSVTNIINGNEYLIKFDDKRKEITISHKDREEIIPLNHKLAKYPKEKLWKIAKTLDVDSLLEIDKHIIDWKYCPDTEASLVKNTKTVKTGEEQSNLIITSGADKNIISHEIGHIKESRINKNKFLIDSYLKEMNIFEKYNTIVEQDLVDYFSPRAEILEAIGFNEMIAESNMLLNSYGCDSNQTSLKIRSQILARYFPDTIFKIAMFLDKASKEPLI